MNFTRKIDRAMQWAGEKMGAEAKATHTEEFKELEAEMDIRHEGMEHLLKSMNIYTRWLARHCDALEDRSRSLPLAHLGKTMTAHAAELPDAEYSRRLASMGNANEQLAELQTTYLDCANATWTQHIERNLAMMKDYQNARKKLESRRLAYDATMGKIQKAKKDDVRLEDELRINKTKFDDSTEDVFQRMSDIREAEQDTIGSLTSFLDAELEYHERAANELRRVRKSWAAGMADATRPSSREDLERAYSNVSIRTQPVRSTIINEAYEGAASPPVYKLNRTMTSREPPPPPPPPASSRPPMMRSATYDTRQPPVIRARAASASFTRMNTTCSVPESRAEDIFDDNSVYSGDNTPSWGERSVSPATSYGSLQTNPQFPVEAKKAPPPPVNRAKKPPPPPVPRKLSTVGY
ncbi:BAR domain-containing protein [Trichoderma atroviride IMI 206040]|uniref:BAR domain-containing protein n=1 Tax=Hypocrea atroviridis (strain ATCC 20476 / IMI 206040) TaxID=452589 RepID=G9NI53_HYPAI|nr:BAR domain-containing protein [Trichoderma atroviride IMI 206040]EHK49767.1 BAR domain-containing protein [Trichoderma atroviride IMI 206040]